MAFIGARWPDVGLERGIVGLRKGEIARNPGATREGIPAVGAPGFAASHIAPVDACSNIFAATHPGSVVEECLDDGGYAAAGLGVDGAESVHQAVAIDRADQLALDIAGLVESGGRASIDLTTAAISL